MDVYNLVGNVLLVSGIILTVITVALIITGMPRAMEAHREEKRRDDSGGKWRSTAGKS